VPGENVLDAESLHLERLFDAALGECAHDGA
jgi:hypothetical protein